MRLQTGKVGWVPKKCFEVPAKGISSLPVLRHHDCDCVACTVVITNYRAAKANELTVERGQDVRIMDATTFIKVGINFGNQIKTF